MCWRLLLHRTPLSLAPWASRHPANPRRAPSPPRRLAQRDLERHVRREHEDERVAAQDQEVAADASELGRPQPGDLERALAAAGAIEGEAEGGVGPAEVEREVVLLRLVAEQRERAFAGE